MDIRFLDRAKTKILLTGFLIFSFCAPVFPKNLALGSVAGPNNYYLPIIDNNAYSSGSTTDWPQLGHDAQHTNASPTQVNPPYCYIWKWDAVSIASRLQPVVSAGRLFLGGMDGVLYARDASTGAPLWSFSTNGPIRNAAAIAGNQVIFSSYDGFTYALNGANGSLLWKTSSGSSATAPLIDFAHQLVYVASTNGILSALNLANGNIQWTYNSGAAILTSPALSQDSSLVFFGNEAMKAIALNASTGNVQWQTVLQGQSLSDRYPVVAAGNVFYRSQPLYFFHKMLQDYGDQIMDQAGTLLPDWAADWSNVRPQIINFLSTQPQFQTFFALNTSSGARSGIAPVLYTYGDNEIPAVPVYQNGSLYLPYRARHGIQTDGGSIHVSSKYDAELGSMNLANLDITGLRNTTPLSGQSQFRMTSDEPSMLTMSGNLLLVDNWERLGGIDVSNGQLIAVGNVSNNWPECGAQCGPGGPNPFFPLSGNPSDPAYPFPAPRSTEGNARGGAVIANGMIYWHVVEGGLAGIGHSNNGSCAAPVVWRDAASSQPTAQAPSPVPASSLSSYVTTDLTQPNPNPPVDLTQRLQNEVRALLSTANGSHLLPYYLERGFSTTFVWPYTYWNSAGKTGLASIGYQAHGSVFWFDPGELLYTLASAYPYLGTDLQAQVRAYMASEMALYPPLQDLPFNDPNHDWLHSGSARELYQVPFRAQLNNWPPVAANITSIYSLWLWSKNTGDYGYAQRNWAQVKNLFDTHKTSIRYYADIAGLIGYYRLATDLSTRDPANLNLYQAAASEAMNDAVSAMSTGKNFSSYLQIANNDFLDPANQATGVSLPVFFGLTPEIGAYLSNELGGQPQNLVNSLEHYNNTGRGLLWWYLTRAGDHDETGESAYLPPTTAWSHFLAHAYIVNDSQSTLRQWLDRPWTSGDLYSIQRIVATIQAR